MKKFFVICLTIIIMLAACTSCQFSNEKKIPDGGIKYQSIGFGNVIQDGEVAIYLYFKSDYPVCKMEYAGTLLDGRGNTLCTFDKTLNFDTPTQNPTAILFANSSVIKTGVAVSFTKVVAYTTEDI